MPRYDTLDEIIKWLEERREYHRGVLLSIGACDNDPSTYANQLAFVIGEYNELIHELQEEQKRRAR